MEECRLFRVTGRVQGVFFRASTQTAARDLGVTGHALNRPDGSVEVLACGSVGALDELQAWLHSGPPMAQVSGVEVSRVEYRDIDSFNTR
ncbi:MAG: acylphosphatase [Woeseia sp.]|nr:acylphosphatase [Woeseia sp.]